MKEILQLESEQPVGGESTTEGSVELSAQRGGTSDTATVENEVSEDDLGLDPRLGYWEDRDYCWVVLCRHFWIHGRENVFYRHRIVLGETDSVSPPPTLKGRFTVRCDSCGREYRYKPSEVLRCEMDLPDSFKPHPLFVR